jgi:hypothetical protein
MKTKIRHMKTKVKKPVAPCSDAVTDSENSNLTTKKALRRTRMKRKNRYMKAREMKTRTEK